MGRNTYEISRVNSMPALFVIHCFPDDPSVVVVGVPGGPACRGFDSLGGVVVHVVVVPPLLVPGH